MSEIPKPIKDDVYTYLREAAIVLDEAEHATELRKGDINFTMAQGVVRSLRDAIDGTNDREMATRWLKVSDEALELIGGSATDAVHAARRLIGDAHYRLASGR
jgi:hypothetical protein